MTKDILRSVALLALAACDPNAPELDEMKRDQREMLFRLGQIDRSVQQAATQPAPSPTVAEPKKYPDKVYDIPVGHSPLKGPKDAPVTIVEFSDFQCPPCGNVRVLVNQVLQAYPKDVKFVYKQFPLISVHDNAQNAAQAATAAGKQGKFWEMHDILYQNQSELGTEKLREYAGKIGVDVPRWARDFESTDVRERVAEEVRDGRSADVDGTPTFFVNGKRVNDRSFEGFKALIEAALRAQVGKKS